MNKPRIIVEVHGGMVQVVYADCDVDVDVLDYDNFYDPNCDEEASSAYEDLICEASLLQKVW